MTIHMPTGDPVIDGAAAVVLQVEEIENATARLVNYVGEAKPPLTPMHLLVIVARLSDINAEINKEADLVRQYAEALQEIER